MTNSCVVPQSQLDLHRDFSSYRTRTKQFPGRSAMMVVVGKAKALVAKRRNVPKESRERLTDVVHPIPVSDFFWKFNCKPEIFRRRFSPPFECRGFMTAIEGRVDLGAGEDRGISLQGASCIRKGCRDRFWNRPSCCCYNRHGDRSRLFRKPSHPYPRLTWS